jgi:hypothetical protein
MVLSRTQCREFTGVFEATSDSAAEPQVRCGDLRVPFGHPAVRQRANVGLRRSASATGVLANVSFPYRQRVLRADGGDRSSCPKVVIPFFKVGPFSERQSRHSSELTGAEATGG